MKVNSIKNIVSKHKKFRKEIRQNCLSKTSTQAVSKKGPSCGFKNIKVIQVSRKRGRDTRSAQTKNMMICSKKDTGADLKYKSDIITPQKETRRRRDTRQPVVIPGFNKPQKKEFLDFTPADDIHKPAGSFLSSSDSSSFIYGEPERLPVLESPEGRNYTVTSDSDEEVSEAEEKDESFCLNSAISKLKVMAKDGMTYEQFRNVFITDKKKPSFTQMSYFRVYEKLLEEC